MSENICSKRCNKIDLTTFEITDDQKISSRWYQLQAPALELIYSHLCLKDRYAMSMICRNWNKEYKSPSVWRRINFDHDVYDISEIYLSTVQCIKEFGEFFRHVRIECCSNLLQIKPLLKVMTSRSQLFSISFKHLMIREFDMDVECTTKFFESQSSLKEIAFDNCRIRGYEIFAIIAKCSKNLKKLKIFELEPYPYVLRDSYIVSNPKQIFGFFMDLTEIEIDGQIFKILINVCFKVMPALSRLKSRSLKLIKLCFTYYILRTYFHQKMEDAALKNFREECPEIKIDVQAINIDAQNIMDLSGLKNMGMRSLHILHCTECYNVRSILNNIIFPENVFYLEIIELRPIKTTNNVVQDIISLLQTCPNLKELILESENPIFGIDSVFDYIINNYRGAFKRFFLVMLGEISLKDMHMFLKIKQVYVEKMEDIGIRLKMNCSFFSRIKVHI